MYRCVDCPIAYLTITEWPLICSCKKKFDTKDSVGVVITDRLTTPIDQDYFYKELQPSTPALSQRKHKQEHDLWLGNLFLEEFRKITDRKTCGCNDAAALMNRWGPEKSLQKIDKLVSIIHLKASDIIDKPEIKVMILETIKLFRSQKKELESIK